MMRKETILALMLQNYQQKAIKTNQSDNFSPHDIQRYWKRVGFASLIDINIGKPGIANLQQMPFMPLNSPEQNVVSLCGRIFHWNP